MGRVPVELPVTTLVSLIAKDNLGEPHVILAGGERYVSPRFAGADDGVDEQARDALAVVQRARVEYYGWITKGDNTSAVLAAKSGRVAMVVVRDGDAVRFHRSDPDHLAESLVRRLPEVPAGRGESISIRAADYATTEGFLREPAVARAGGEARQPG